MRTLRTQENSYIRMIKALEKQYPELRGYVGAHRSKKRRSDEAFEEENEAQPTAKRARSGVPGKFKKPVREWHATCTSALKSHKTLTSFPSPVAWPCHISECATLASQRTLRACSHNIVDACDGLTKRQLKIYRTLFHPDKFSVCRAEEREKWKEMANEVFVVLGELWEEKIKTLHWSVEPHKDDKQQYT